MHSELTSREKQTFVLREVIFIIKLIPFHSIYSKEYSLEENENDDEYFFADYPEDVTKYGVPSEMIPDEELYTKYLKTFCVSIFKYDDESNEFLGNVKGYYVDGENVHEAILCGCKDELFYVFDDISEIVSRFYTKIWKKYIDGNMSTALITQYPETAYGYESEVLRLLSSCLCVECNEVYLTNGFRELTDDDFCKTNDISERKHQDYLKSKMTQVDDMFYKIYFGYFPEVL